MLRAEQTRRMGMLPALVQPGILGQVALSTQRLSHIWAWIELGANSAGAEP